MMLLGQLEFAASGFPEPGGVALLLDLAQDARVYGVDNVAEGPLVFDRMIARSRLRPRYGSGWQPG